MPSRVLAFFIAVVLLWSGLNTIEAPRVVAQTSPERLQAILHAGGQGAVHEGSVEHHHLDDVPTQAHSEPPLEMPGLLPTPLTAKLQPLTARRPRSPSSAATSPPFIAGNLRPPCDAAFAG